MLIALQEGLSKVHFTADRSSHASALYSAEEQAKQAKKKVKQCLFICNKNSFILTDMGRLC